MTEGKNAVVRTRQGELLEGVIFNLIDLKGCQHLFKFLQEG